MAEDPQPMTLQQRIAALNAAHIGRVPGDPPRPAPVVPIRRPELNKAKTFNNPPERLQGSVTQIEIGNRPAPPPLPARKQPPPLPARKKSLEDQRRDSTESTTSVITNGSVASKSSAPRANSNDRIKAPAWGGCELPALPPRGVASAPRTYSNERPKYVNRAPSSTASVATVGSVENRRPSQPQASVPPPLPARKFQVENEGHEEVCPPSQGRRPPIFSSDTLDRVKKSALSYALNKPRPGDESLPTTNGTSQPPQTPVSQSSVPPPVPLSSRPDLSAIQATKPKFNSTSTTPQPPASPVDVCLVCRDFSGPDTQATLFPRHQVNSLQTLAHQLTSPFPSPTDQARAIFTWLHHNIAYDVANFFNGSVKGSTPQSTLQTGLAVCEGYAALFTHLATFAGLESIIISGHGKGYGYQPLAPGSPLPPYNAGHAWNAVRVDNGEWKLIDACWGAGHVQGKGMPYVQKFTPEYFTMPNEEFAVKHFPGNKDQFFLPGGRRMSWEEYMQINPANWPHMVEAPTIFTSAKEDYYIGERTVLPRNRKISVSSGGLIRFQFGLLCPHWTLDRHGSKGLPPVFIVQIHGVDGRNRDLMPLERVHGGANGGDMWYADIDSKQLGAPGQTITLFAVTSFGERTQTRGLTVREFRDGKGRVGMGFTGVAAWDLVA